MTFKNLNKLKRSIIVNIDNYSNEHLSDPIFIKYVIDSSEKGGSTAFLTKSLENFRILKESTKLPILFEADDINLYSDVYKFNEVLDMKPNFIVIDIGKFVKYYGNLEMIVSNIRFKFKGELLGRIENRETALSAYKYNLDGIILEVFGENIDKNFISRICSDVNIPLIVSLNSVELDDCKQLVDAGVHCFILGEDVTNPNKILNKL